MLINLHDLIKKYNLIFKGILHVGAHECEELIDYLQYLQMDKTHFKKGDRGQRLKCGRLCAHRRLMGPNG
mgnify:CR=1 FL=1